MQLLYDCSQVRSQHSVQELRHWQRDWREENENIQNKVEDFWAKQMPESCENADNSSSGKTSADSRKKSKSTPVKNKDGEDPIVAIKNIPEGQITLPTQN